MKYKINGTACRIVFDEPASRFFIIGGSVWVYDLKTNEKIARLNDISYPTYVYVSHKNNIVLVQSTDGRFAFYTADTLSFLGKLKIRGCHNTDEAFYYDEEENAAYGVYTHGRGEGGVGYGLAEIYPDKVQYSAIYLPQLNLDRETQRGEKPYTTYEFHRHTQDGYYILRRFYNVGEAADSSSGIYECCYGWFGKEGNNLVLKEKLLTTNEKFLEMSDITEQENSPIISKFCKTFSEQEYLHHTYRNERGLFLITNQAVYRLLTDSEFEEVCREQYMSDYAEYGGKQYICTWERCIIQDL